MTDQHPSGNGRLTEKAFTGGHAHQPVPGRFQEGHQAGEICERRPPVPGQGSKSVTNKANHFDWQMVALWVFVAVAFAALMFAGYLIWAKCRGPSHF